MIRSTLLGVFLATASAGAVPLESLAPVEQEVTRYESGDYLGAAEALQEVLLAKGLTKAEEERARTYLAAAHFALGNLEQSREQLVALVKLAPGATVDPLIFPSRFVALLEEVRREVRPTLFPPLLEPLPPRKSASLALALTPFGAGQFANGAPKKGVFFLSAEVLAFGTAAATLIAFESSKLPGSPGLFGCSERVPCRFEDPAQAQLLQTVSFAAFWTGTAIAAAGIVDALLDR